VPLVLTDASSVQCLHAGALALAGAATGVLTVDGKTALSGSLADATIAACKQTAPNTVQCQTASSQNAGGTSHVLKVEGVPVLLESASGITSGSPGNTWSVKDAAQTLLKAE
jgi:hypothetical protein